RDGLAAFDRADGRRCARCHRLRRRSPQRRPARGPRPRSERRPLRGEGPRTDGRLPGRAAGERDPQRRRTALAALTSGVRAGPTRRVAWLDIARAMSIVLVVIYHVAVGGAGHVLLGGRETFIGKLWIHGNLALVPLRMPLFFMVSGVLAAG